MGHGAAAALGTPRWVPAPHPREAGGPQGCPTPEGNLNPCHPFLSPAAAQRPLAGPLATDRPPDGRPAIDRPTDGPLPRPLPTHGPPDGPPASPLAPLSPPAPEGRPASPTVKCSTPSSSSPPHPPAVRLGEEHRDESGGQLLGVPQALPPTPAGWIHQEAVGQDPQMPPPAVGPAPLSVGLAMGVILLGASLGLVGALTCWGGLPGSGERWGPRLLTSA